MWDRYQGTYDDAEVPEIHPNKLSSTHKGSHSSLRNEWLTCNHLYQASLI